MNRYQALETLEATIESAILEPDTGSVQLPESPFFPKGRRFNRLNQLLDELEDVLYDDLASFRAYGAYGEVEYDDDVRNVIESIVHESWIPAFLEVDSPIAEGRNLLDADSLVDPSKLGLVRVEIADLNEELIRYLARHPEMMHDLKPRTFEGLVAELFRDMGYEVVLTPQSRDGGMDMRAYRKEPFGTVLTVVECKRLGRDRKVSVGVVRSLVGVLGIEQASHGVLATTSFFSPPALELQEQMPFRLSLNDYDDLVSWCKSYRHGKVRPTPR